MSRARQHIECAFGILSNKWRVFHSNILVAPDFSISITKATCILHNFVRRRDGFNIEDTFSCPLEDVDGKRGVGNSPLEAKTVREYFVNYVNDHKFSLAWQNKVLG